MRKENSKDMNADAFYILLTTARFEFGISYISSLISVNWSANPQNQFFCFLVKNNKSL